MKPGGFSVGRSWSIARKEVRHLARDRFTLAMALGVPMFLVIFFGYVLDYDVKNIRLLVIDRDHSRASRQLKDVWAGAAYFTPVGFDPGAPPLTALEEGHAKVLLFIEPGFARDVATRRPVRAQVVVDGSDNQTTSVIASYALGLEAASARRLLEIPPSPVEWRTRFLFNPELNSRWFVVTGLFVVVVGVLSILLTALTVAREWETGSMELLLSTPVQPLEIVLGKLAPYMALCLGAVGLVYVTARVAFGVPFEGSHLTFLLACVLFLLCTLSQGLLISIITRQQQLAMQFSNLTGLLPSTLLSGFIFPVESMPPFFQRFTMLLPPRWFIAACRGIFLKGEGLRELTLPLSMLAALGSLLIFLAVRRFKRDLEP